jgi:hypothetical protein
MDTADTTLSLKTLKSNLMKSFLLLQVADYNIKFQAEPENLVCDLFRYLPAKYANEFCFNLEWSSIES